MYSGHPIIAATAEKILDEVDYRGSGSQPLDFIRYFRSNRVVGPQTGVGQAGLGDAWSHNYSAFIVQTGTAGTADSLSRVFFGDGVVRAFQWGTTTSAWLAADSVDTLTASGVGLLYSRADDNSNWQFGADGKLQTKTERNGWVSSYNYSTSATTTSFAPVAGLLVSVSNQFTRTVSFAYNTATQLISVSLPGSQSISFSYDTTTSTTSLGRLSTVTYPGSLSGTVSKAYLYENSTLLQLVTGIADETGNRLATYSYDTDGKAISTQYAGGADLYSVSYGTSTVAATVTDPLGTARAYNYTFAKGSLVISGATWPIANAEDDASSRVVG